MIVYEAVRVIPHNSCVRCFIKNKEKRKYRTNERITYYQFKDRYE